MSDVQQARLEAAARVYDEAAMDSPDDYPLQYVEAMQYARDMIAAADAVVTVEAIIGVLDREGAQCGLCGREPGDPADCAVCVRVLERYAAAIQRLYRGEERS